MLPFDSGVKSRSLSSLREHSFILMNRKAPQISPMPQIIFFLLPQLHYAKSGGTYEKRGKGSKDLCSHTRKNRDEPKVKNEFH
jgi:hypothetical protein